MDPDTGEVIDRRHPQTGASLAGRVVAMPAGRGSSSSSSVLAEAIRAGTAPAAILLREPDGIVALGAMVAGELYGLWCPVVALDPGEHSRLRDGDLVAVEADEDGTVVRYAEEGGTR
jgi:predicted aconitase with swiveling domain